MFGPSEHSLVNAKAKRLNENISISLQSKGLLNGRKQRINQSINQ